MFGRIREIRKDNNLSQAEFAEKLGLQRNSISLMENGKMNLSTRTINDICEKFNINESWLRTGEGYKQKTEINKKNEDSDLIKEIYSGNDPQRIAILRVAAKVIQDDYCWDLIERTLISAMKEPDINDKRQNIEKEVASYRHELETELKGAEELKASRKLKDA